MMILRQFCVRHGRTVLGRSSQTLARTYATETSRFDSRISEQDGQPTMPILGHPDDPSSLIDAIPIHPTPRTRQISQEIQELESASKALHSQLNSHIAAKIGGIASTDAFLSALASTEAAKVELSEPSPPEIPFRSAKEFKKYRREAHAFAHAGTKLIDTYDPFDIIHKPPSPDQVTLPMLLAHQAHLGHHTSLWNPSNSSYIFGVRDGIHIISLDVTYAYLQRAAKVVREVARRGGIILFIGTRKNQSEIVVRAAARAKSYHIFDRWVPGSLTNGQQILGHCALKFVDVRDNELTQYSSQLRSSAHPVLRPDLVVCLNPLENEVCLHECGLYNVPTIGVIDTDANPSWVTYPIPANDDSLRSIALIAGVLGRAGEEGQKLRQVAAEEGKTTYSTKAAQEMLAGLEEIASINVQDPA